MVAAEKLAGFAAIALFMAAGWGWGEVLPAVRRSRRVFRWGSSYLLGVAWIAGGLYGLSHLLGVPLRRPAIWALALVPLVAGIVVRVRRRPRRVSPGTRQAERSGLLQRSEAVLGLIAVLLVGVVSLAVLAEVVTHPSREWDGRMTWSTQAKYVRAAASVDAPALRDPATFITLSHYPLLMPVAQVVAQELVGAGDDDPAPRTVYVPFFAVFLALIWSGVRSRGPAGPASLTVILVALLPFLAFYAAGGANSAYSDLPLACFYGAGLSLLLARRLDLSSGLAGGLLLCAAVLVKDEGATFAVLALLLAAATWIWRRKSGGGSLSLRRAAPFFLAAGLVVLSIVFLAHWRAGIPLRYTPDYRGALAARGLVRPLIERTSLLLSRIGHEMGRRDLWGTFWFSAPWVLLAGRRGLRRLEAPALSLAALAPLGLVYFVYLVTDIPAALPGMTWNRFLLQAGVPLFTLFGWALSEVLRSTPARLAGAAPAPRTGP